MNHIWSPWRGEYIQNADKFNQGCVFCKGYEEGVSEENLVLYRKNGVLVILNKFPYNNGHLMVVPASHKNSIVLLEDDELSKIAMMIKQSVKILKQVYNPDGFNIGSNIGRVAGAGIAEHVHFHVVPRWNGDTNFMPVVGDTKVISEALKTTYEKLLPFFKEL